MRISVLTIAPEEFAGFMESHICKRAIDMGALTPRGERFSQNMAKELAEVRHLIMVCGHFEGMDERIYAHMPGDKKFKTKELSSQIGSARLSFADPEDMLKHLDIEPGAVSIMGLMNDKDHAGQGLIERMLR